MQALAYQYQCSLERINDNLPRIDIALVVKQGCLQYEPPLEEVHVTHYKSHLKPLLAIPLNFKVSLADNHYLCCCQIEMHQMPMYQLT